jgi:hypothetical protein
VEETKAIMQEELIIITMQSMIMQLISPHSEAKESELEENLQATTTREDDEHNLKRIMNPITILYICVIDYRIILYD